MRALGLILLAVVLTLLTSCNFLSSNDEDQNNTTEYSGGMISNVRFVIESPHNVRIKWNENFADEQGFRIDRREWDGEWHNRLITVSANDSTVVDTTAELGKVYYYHVYAYKGNSESVKDNYQFNFDLPAVQNIDYSFSWQMPDSIMLLWKNLSPWADSIVVSKKVSGAGEYARKGVLAGNATEWIDYSYAYQSYSFYRFRTWYQGRSTYSDTQFIIDLPAVQNIDYSFNLQIPDRITFLWENQTTWADSIVASKKVAGEPTYTRKGVLAGNATEWTDYYYVYQSYSFYRFTTWYQGRSTYSGIEMVPPKKK